jgi:hypothetical protein
MHLEQSIFISWINLLSRVRQAYCRGNRPVKPDEGRAGEPMGDHSSPVRLHQISPSHWKVPVW